MRPPLPSALAAMLALLATPAHAADKPIRAFILAGQSNMVGWGDSTKLSDDLRKGSDTKNADVAKEYLDNLKSLVAAVRKDTGVADLRFVYGSPRREGIPDDLTDFKPPRLPPGRPGAFLVLKAQFDAQKEIPKSKMVILRDIEKHPKNVHFNTEGQLKVGRLFAEAFLESFGEE